MCCPDSCKLAVRGVSQAIELLNNEKLKNMRVFVICQNPEAALKVIKGIDESTSVNLGGMQKMDDREFFSKAVYLSKQDISYLDQIEELGFNIEVQEVPETSMLQYKNLRNKFSK